ncbi:MAG: HDOD domain-containing protein [Gammaproteobacteria bacterium]|nr:HDOD domain-containing protein [Gammaproteobacteria bacterium]
MSNNRPLAFWLDKLSTETFPILRRSREQLLAMERNIDRITDDDIAKEIYHDPFLMANLLRRVARLPRRGLAGEVTTVDRAVMMLGMQPFFLWVKSLPVLEDVLRGKTPVLQRLHGVLSYSYHAAYQALQWSFLRKDINADEVFIATLLQNRIAWAGWLLMPGEMLLIEQYMRRERMDFSNAFSRHTDYLFDDVQSELAKKWGWPALYSDFLHSHNAVRGQGAILALKLAETVQQSWWQPAVEQAVMNVAEWLNQPVDEIETKIHIYCVQAARQSEGWYGSVTPAAAWLPLLPGAWPDDPLHVVSAPVIENNQVAAANVAVEKPPVQAPKIPPAAPTATPVVKTAPTIPAPSEINSIIKPAGEPAQAAKHVPVPVPEVRAAPQVIAKADPVPPPVVAQQVEPVITPVTNAEEHVLHPEVVERIINDIKAHMDGSFDISQLMVRILTAMHDGLAMDRVVFGLLSPDQSIKARFTRGIDEGSPMQRLNFSLLEKHLFAQLMVKMQAIWYRPETQQKLAPLLLPKLRAQIGRGEFMAMSVHVHNKPLGFFYADYGDKGHMDENIYNGFKQLCTLAAEGMAHLSKKPKS